MTLATATTNAGRPVMRSLLGLFAPWRGRALVVALLVVASAAAEVAPTLILKVIVDAHLAVGNGDGVLLLAAAYLAAIGLAQGLTFLYTYVAATVSQAALSHLRTTLFAHLQQLPTGTFDEVPMGDLISRCTADVDALDTVFSSNISVLIANMVRIGAIGVTMLALSPPLTLAVALVLPPLALATGWVQRRVRTAERETRTAVGQVNATLQETLRGVEVIRAFDLEAVFGGRFRRVLERGLAAAAQSTFFAALYTPLTALLAAIAIAALLWSGALLQATPLAVSFGTLTAFALLVQRFFAPVNALGEEWQTVQAALAGAERVFGTLALPTEATQADDAAATMPPAPLVRVHRVAFGYAPDRPVLHGVSLTVAAGEHVALVGRTGAGKTTALHLLAGLYTPWQGEVSIAGHAPAAMGNATRQRLLGVVPQTVQLFSDTVAANITLGEAGVTGEAMRAAAHLAGADTFITALPEGYETPLRGSGGGRGVQLSAGQAQLLALARALVHRPALLLLDEATAALDAESDAAFRAALRTVTAQQQTAVITIAHRLATALSCDRIVLFDQGRIVEEGPPQALAAKGGRLAALLELEAAGWDWRAPQGQASP